MKNEKRIPFETIEKVVEGEPEAIHNVVCYYRGYMKYRKCKIIRRIVLP